MPSITGGSSTSRDYAPHMYILREGGGSGVDDDYIFVGNAEASYDDNNDLGKDYHAKLARVKRLGREVTYPHYHIGVSQVEGLVGDVRMMQLQVVRDRAKDYLYDTGVYGSHRGIPASEIPEAAKNKLIGVGLKEIATLSGHTILGGLGVELPTDLELIDFGKAFNGTPAERAAEQAKGEQWGKVADELRQTYGIE